ncbi:jg18645 [Pararge aegeria aegeria]|uniref:Jg18645 protein n=1 Tax=Pararge aegeria aegeria TaxID=348720 RepID=A0A8S4RBE8_9NEOP|nr:jg18645 [Pararge aegeria aegeria]
MFAASYIGRTADDGDGDAAESLPPKKKPKIFPTSRPLPLCLSWWWRQLVAGWGALRFSSRRLVVILREGGCDRFGDYLAQRLPIAIQRGNAASLMGSLGPGVTKRKPILHYY